MKLILNAPFNSLSFGNVSYNIIRELFKKNIETLLFPIADKVDLKAYDKMEESFQEYLKKSSSHRFDIIEKSLQSLKVWHINGSETRIGKNQNLFTFHETSELTQTEINILNLQDKIFVTNEETKKIFNINGVDNVYCVKLGFDEDFHVVEKEFLPEKIHFGLMGKLEHRKNTSRIIKSWLKLFGNNPKYQLSCAITNPFLNQQDFNNSISKITEGKNYNNLNLIPYMQTNSEVNDFLNSIDIDLGGLSGAEGWNLPSFNATALGKWSVVMNHTGHKSWATKDNSILVEPSSMKESHDGTFFTKGSPFNQGMFYDISDDEIEEAILKSCTYAKTENKKGLEMQKTFSYKDTTETILNIVHNQ